MSEPSNHLEIIWEQLLSRDPEQIRRAYFGLEKGTQREVFDHLHKMAVEEGWHPEQRASAQAALQAIGK
ncbi:MAG: hypothetical protein P4L50_02205 [Anaerolineaceae bacterium]|nr:hypothetical protein [Anaerolineaceae bacterium]